MKYIVDPGYMKYARVHDNATEAASDYQDARREDVWASLYRVRGKTLERAQDGEWYAIDRNQTTIKILQAAGLYKVR